MTDRRPLLVFGLISAFAVLPLLAAQQNEARVKAIGGKYLCMCGCGQILTQCNHVGCTTSAAMLKELSGWVARGDSDDTINKAFLTEYGTTVYAEPPKSGFSLIAWAMPVIYFLLGLAIVLTIISRWRKEPQAVATPGVSAGSNLSADALERARAQADRDTED